ncbi:MAG: hypothetical protein M3Y71_11765 [Actinomycetota bacterium]|nr:hypothetical protein [Actinomycetota bacterium]
MWRPQTCRAPGTQGRPGSCVSFGSSPFWPRTRRATSPGRGQPLSWWSPAWLCVGWRCGTLPAAAGLFSLAVADVARPDLTA